MTLFWKLTVPAAILLDLKKFYRIENDYILPKNIVFVIRNESNNSVGHCYYFAVK